MNPTRYTVGSFLKTIASLLADGELDINAPVCVGDYEGNNGDAYLLSVSPDAETKGLRIDHDPDENI